MELVVQLPFCFLEMIFIDFVAESNGGSRECITKFSVTDRTVTVFVKVANQRNKILLLQIFINKAQIFGPLVKEAFELLLADRASSVLIVRFEFLMNVDVELCEFRCQFLDDVFNITLWKVLWVHFHHAESITISTDNFKVRRFGTSSWQC